MSAGQITQPNPVYDTTEDPFNPNSFSDITGRDPEYYQVRNDYTEHPGFCGFQLQDRPSISTLRIFNGSDSDDSNDSNMFGTELTVIQTGTPNASQVKVNPNNGWCQVHTDHLLQYFIATYDSRGTNNAFDSVEQKVADSIGNQIEEEVAAIVPGAVSDAITAATPGIVSSAIAAISVTDTDSIDFTYNAGTGNLTGTARGIVNQGSEALTLRKKTIAIGDWNMNSTASIDVAHGLTAANIRSITGQIRNDSNNTFYQITPGDGGGTSQRAYVEYHDNTNVRLGRNGTALFGINAEFDGTGFSRGFITIEYLV